MIILALITMEGSGIQIEEASTAEYKYELKGIEVTVSAQRTSNQLDGIGEEFKEKGFFGYSLLVGLLLILSSYNPAQQTKTAKKHKASPPYFLFLGVIIFRGPRETVGFLG